MSFHKLYIPPRDKEVEILVDQPLHESVLGAASHDMDIMAGLGSIVGTADALKYFARTTTSNPSEYDICSLRIVVDPTFTVEQYMHAMGEHWFFAGEIDSEEAIGLLAIR